MIRLRNTDRCGRSFNELAKQAVWKKGRPIPGYDAAIWKYDCCGAPMNWNEYGNTDSKYGWEIDHIWPVALGGGDDLDNLQPLQWRNNRSKGDQSPSGGNFCVVGG